MRKFAAKEKEARRKRLLAFCQETRQQCNKLTGEERRKLREKTLAFIGERDAEASARSR
jgi:hypothetical protein